MLLNAFNVLESATGGEENPGGGAGAFVMIFVWVAVIAVMYFIMIRPQKKKQKAEQKMRDSLQVGDEVVTIGGIHGRVVSLKEDSFVLESAADHTKLKCARWALGQNLTIHDDTPSK